MQTVPSRKKRLSELPSLHVCSLYLFCCVVVVANLTSAFGPKFPAEAMPRAQKRKMVHDVELTDVDSDSDMDRNPIRLPSGLPLDEPPPQISADTHMEVEHVCRRHLNNRYIPMDVSLGSRKTYLQNFYALLHLQDAEPRLWPSLSVPTTTPVQLAYGATPRSTRAQQHSLHIWSGRARTQTLRPYPCCATSTWPPTWTDTTNPALSMCSCHCRHSAVENFGLKKNTDQTCPRKANIKDAIILFVCPDWSSVPLPGTQRAHGKMTDWSSRRTPLFEPTPGAFRHRSPRESRIQFVKRFLRVRLLFSVIS